MIMRTIGHSRFSRSPDAKTRTKQLILRDPTISTTALHASLEREGIRLSEILIYDIRSSFLADLKLLKKLNLFDAWTKQPRKRLRRHRYQFQERWQSGRHPDTPKPKRFKPWRFSG